MKNKPKVTVKCETHKVYYCLKTGGLRCRKCKVLLNDFGNEYKKSNNMKYMELKSDYDVLKGIVAKREKDIEAMAATINRLKDAHEEILEIGRDFVDCIETLGKIEKVAENALEL